MRSATTPSESWIGTPRCSSATTRCISDFSYATYLSDLAVAAEYQRAGIGRALIAAVQEEAPAAKIILLSAPAAVDYYPHIGFTQHQSAWVLNARPRPS